MGFLDKWKEKEKVKQQKYYETYYRELDYQKLCKLMKENSKIESKVTLVVGDQLDVDSSESMLTDIAIYCGTDIKGNLYYITEEIEKSDFNKGDKITIYGRLIQRLNDNTVPMFFIYYYKNVEE